MKHSVLIIDDERMGAVNLSRAFQNEKPELYVEIATSEEEIEEKIRNLYYDVAIVDLRMDSFSVNGFDIIRNIIEVNPFAKIIIMSAYLTEFSEDITQILTSGKIAAIVPKIKFDEFKVNVFNHVDKVIRENESNPILIQNTLIDIYANAKNESNAYLKGTKFEQFVSILFSQMGFPRVIKRVIDQSRNEVDLVVRNEIKDGFFQKFKQYILVECKNTSEKVDKNNFIQFRSKLEHSSALSDLGILITSNAIKKTAFDEAIRSSDKNYKIIFISNKEINRLIFSDDLLETFKVIVDEQVKDN